MRRKSNLGKVRSCILQVADNVDLSNREGVDDEREEQKAWGAPRDRRLLAPVRVPIDQADRSAAPPKLIRSAAATQLLVLHSLFSEH